jgi:hypothetical protein
VTPSSSVHRYTSLPGVSSLGGAFCIADTAAAIRRAVRHSPS